MRRHRRRVRADRRHRSAAGQGLLVCVGRPARRPRTCRVLSRRVLCHAAPDCCDVPSLPCPHDCHVERVTHIRGDTWNVNPIALARVEKLFCRNERVLIRTRLEATGQLVTLVPVAAILVACIRLHFLDLVVDPKRSLLLAIPCEIPFRKGQEMGARLCASPGCDKREWNRRVRSDHRTHQEFPPLRFPL